MGPSQRERFERMAGEWLWETTNRKFGICEAVVRPCRTGCGTSGRNSTFWGRGPYPWNGHIDAGSWVPLLIAGEWFNMGCGCAGACSCSAGGSNVIRLPGPVVEVTEVMLDGVVLSPDEYRVMYGRNLVRVDGDWPACQDLNADPSEEGTFQVTYRKGLAVPIGGQIAAGLLAQEFAKAYCRDDSCQLPQRIQTVTRDGVTVTLMDNFQDLKEGGTGIWSIDNWVASVNRPRPYSSVRSVDVKQSVRAGGW